MALLRETNIISLVYKMFCVHVAAGDMFSRTVQARNRHEVPNNGGLLCVK